MATWASYLGLGKKTEEALKTTVSESVDVREEASIIQIDTSSTYGGKAAENAIIKPIITAMELTPSTFVKGFRRTQSDAPTPQVAQNDIPRRAQSNASRVARMFGYGNPTQEELALVALDPVEAATEESRITAPPQINKKVDGKDMNPTSLGDVVKATTQPKLLEDVDESMDDQEIEFVQLEADKAMLEYEKKSEQIRMEREQMEAERERMLLAQEKMRLELEWMAQEEGEILEYYKMMEIEKPRPRKILATPINMTQKYIGKVKTDAPPPKFMNETERVFEQRLEQQQELDRGTVLQQERMLEQDDQGGLLNDETAEFLTTVIPKENSDLINAESESEYGDEIINDDDDYTGDSFLGQEITDSKRDFAVSFRDMEEEYITSARTEYETDVLQYQAEREEEEVEVAVAEKPQRGSRLDEAKISRAAEASREAERLEVESERLEMKRLEKERLKVEEGERVESLDREMEENFRRQEIDRESQEQKAILLREELERETRKEEEYIRRQELEWEEEENLPRGESERDALLLQEIKIKIEKRRQREQQLREAERIAKQKTFEEERRASQQRRQDAEFKAERKLEIARVRTEKEAAEAEQAAFEKAAEIRKAEEKMQLAFAAMATVKGVLPAMVPTVLPADPGFPPAGRRSLIDTNELANRQLGSFPRNGPQPPAVLVSPKQNTLRPRHSIRGGLPSGPKGSSSGLHARRKPSVGQNVQSRSAASSTPQDTHSGAVQRKEEVLRPHLSNRSGLPSGPRDGMRPPQRNVDRNPFEWASSSAQGQHSAG